MIELNVAIGENMSDIINYQTSGTCCKIINLKIENDIIQDVEFLGGCSGNLGGIRQLILGQNINEVAKKLRGIPCGAKSTSCPDQLAICLEEYINKKQTANV